MRIAVLGAGISGLAAAHALYRRRIPFILFERTGRTGGVVRSESKDGFLIEHGPNSFQPKSEIVLDLLADLHLGERMTPASTTARNRYVAKGGALHPVPSSLTAFLRTPLYSSRAKIRLLKEPFVKRGAVRDESVAAFVRRRLGHEFLDYAVDPFVAGIYAGDPGRISIRHAFPGLFDLERLHGSLVRGAIKTFRSRRKSQRHSEWPPEIRKGILSFDYGMQVLADALLEGSEANVRPGHSVSRIARRGEEWVVTAENANVKTEEAFDAVISTVPLHSLPRIVSDAPVDASHFSGAYYAPLTILHLGFDRAQIDHPLDGFGMLVPSKEPHQILGALFSSSQYPDRSPSGKVLLTVFVGGSRRPVMVNRSTDELVENAMGDLAKLLGTSGSPIFVNRVDWPRAIPQYEVGYGAVKERLTTIEARNPGLKFAGNYRQGVSVSDVLESGWRAALHFALPGTIHNRIEPLHHLQSRGGR